MITSSGAICDICGNYILPLEVDEKVNFFGVKGIKGQLCCHNKCKDLVVSIGKDWKKLPKKGNLYKAFEKANNELKNKQEVSNG